MSHCCKSIDVWKAKSLIPGVRGFLAWLFPSAVLVLMPKCPACLAVYVGLWTGLGLSFTTATYLRWSMLMLCVTCLLFLAVRWFKRRRITCSPITHFFKESKKCNLK